MYPAGMEGKEIAKRTPAENFCQAMKEYARSEFPGQTVIVTDYAAVLYVEFVDVEGNPTGTYLNVSSRHSSWHALRGLVQTLADHIYRKRPT